MIEYFNISESNKTRNTLILSHLQNTVHNPTSNTTNNQFKIHKISTTPSPHQSDNVLQRKERKKNDRNRDSQESRTEENVEEYSRIGEISRWADDFAAKSRRRLAQMLLIRVGEVKGSLGRTFVPRPKTLPLHSGEAKRVTPWPLSPSVVATGKKDKNVFEGFSIFSITQLGIHCDQSGLQMQEIIPRFPSLPWDHCWLLLHHDTHIFFFSFCKWNKLSYISYFSL